MRYSNAWQIIAMTIVWALMLVTYDRLFSKGLFAPTPEQVARLTTPEVWMRIDHVACSGGSEEVVRAIKTLPWLGEPEVKEEPKLLSAEENKKARLAVSCAIVVMADVHDVAQADFVEVTNALRKFGIFPAGLEFGGIPHFALEAEVSHHIRCPSCEQAAKNAMTPKKDPELGVTFKWLDSARVNQEAKTITAYVKYNHIAHIGVMIRALDQAGFPPLSMGVQVGK